MKTPALGLLAVVLVGWGAACGSATPSGSTDAGDGGAPDATQHCTGNGAVCASGPGFSCAQQFASSDCLGGVCCMLAPGGNPPYYDDAGTCPGMCASPDDIGCPNWYRSDACGSGSLCCVLGSPADAGAD